MTSVKPKVAFYWCASCGGCEVTVLDLEEKLLDVAAAVEILFWPAVLDFKKADVEAMTDGSLTAAFVNGSVRTSEQEEMALLMRKKSQLLFAFGSCAQLGGVHGLANLSSKEALFQTAYGDAAPPRTESHADGFPLDLPEFLDHVRAIDQVVEVDYYIPGCPPTPKLVWQALEALLAGRLPERGAVLAPDLALCDECPRKETKPEKLTIEQFRRPHLTATNDKDCLLAQGLLCLGSATRAGCEALCVRANMPCNGCFGPTSRVSDYGAKALSGIASLAAGESAGEVERVLVGIADPTGLLYRYSLPASLLYRTGPPGR